MAFFPTRRALVAEGPSEMVLVPALLREALGVAHLNFQVVPGLSSVSRTKLPALNANGSHVCYLVDADSGGAAIVELLRTASVPDPLIFKLCIGRKLGHSIEDFVNLKVLLAAANRIGTLYTEGWIPIASKDISNIGRADSIKQAFEARGQTRFSKVDLAYAIVDIVEETGLPACDPRRVDTLRQLGTDIQTILQEEGA